MDPGELFYNMDPASVHSLSGVVLAREIRQVLDKDPLYYTLLQTVRAWVRARSINSFIYGFPPSVAWTIMVAYICKRISDGFDPLTCVCETGTHPGSGTNRQQHSITCMLLRFFCVFSSWDWPRPVLLTPVRDILNLSVRAWKWQENRSKDVALMPVISPAFPNKNTTFSVREATKNIAIRELQRGRDILRNMFSTVECL
ncbi:hypothetical protein FGIG_10410 [Fasciola gigantica]|uniref:polynucleotide adenylyltransferase n=1 Tax=Fasciola gigantica TaxID=46835 RepID=A0A504Y9Y4_FASGI|nr:hypothetical protein FGIG_10410 [Fasciola gigantica]